MTLMKSLLLGSATGLVAVAGAQAADLPTKKAAPAAANYVKVCSIPGGAGFVIPGSETCLQFSGFVAVELIYAQRKAPNNTTADRFGIDGRGSLTFDAYTNTAWGLMQSEARFDGNSGGAGVPGNYSTGGGFGLDHAFFKVGGLEGGVLNGSYFNQSGAGTITDNFGAPDIGGAAYLGYTASFGGGFFAGVAIEDNVQHLKLAPGLVRTGEKYPDLAGKIGISQAWGAAALSGELHHVGLDSTSTNGAYGKWGWGIAGAVKVNATPMISAEVTADYAKGIGKLFANAVGGVGEGTAGYSGSLSDAVALAGGGYVLPTHWGVGGDIGFTVNPQLALKGYASYGHQDFSGTGLVANAPSTLKGWNVGLDTTFTPITQLSFDLNVLYEKITASGGAQGSSGFLGRLQITRSF